MKRILFVVLAAGLLLGMSGCFSTGFMGFLATTEMVDKKVAEQQAAVGKDLDAQRAEMEQMKKDLAEVTSLKDQAKATVEEIRALSKKVEGKLVTIPKETLQKLVDILQAALSQE
jgi:membrane protein involved in colicin uptake